MHDVVFTEKSEGIQNLPQVFDGFFFRQRAFFFKKNVKAAPIAKLIYEVEIVGGFEHVDILDDMVALFF